MKLCIYLIRKQVRQDKVGCCILSCLYKQVDWFPSLSCKSHSLPPQSGGSDSGAGETGKTIPDEYIFLWLNPQAQFHLGELIGPLVRQKLPIRKQELG